MDSTSYRLETNSSNGFNFFDLRILFIVIVIIVFIVIFYNNYSKIEEMSPGVVTQMYAQDAQDTYLKGNVDQIATGNYLLNWNQPTRLATGSYYYTTGPNRGALLKNLCSSCKKKNCNCKKGPVYYPNAYTGNYFQFPTPDINYPLPYIVSNGAFVKEGFENNQTSDAKFIFFYVDWCSHCKNFKPTFDELKEKASNIPIKLEEIDADKNPEMIKKYNVVAFPTLILEVNNKPIKYERERTSEDILKFINKHL
jgi:thiol-disulfide isomerase/thioredoxin